MNGLRIGFRRCSVIASLIWVGATVPVVRTCFAQEAAIPGPKEGKVSGPVLVPADSWVYPALLRLGALGYITGQSAGMRPWTRQECVRQVAEAESALSRPSRRAANREEAQSLLQALEREFGRNEQSTVY